MLQIGEVIVTEDLLTEHFSCDLTACQGACCIEGDAGAPLTTDEALYLEDIVLERCAGLGEGLDASLSEGLGEGLDASLSESLGEGLGEEIACDNFSRLCPRLQPTQPLYEVDIEGDLVTACHPDGACVFTTYDRDHCLRCTLESHNYTKPQSCSLYPLRMKTFSNGLTGLNYHRWAICHPARLRGEREDIRLYQFLRIPLVRAFGEAWYEELCLVARSFKPHNS